MNYKTASKIGLGMIGEFETYGRKDFYRCKEK
jgi:hypothetical protein